MRKFNLFLITTWLGGALIVYSGSDFKVKSEYFVQALKVVEKLYNNND